MNAMRKASPFPTARVVAVPKALQPSPRQPLSGERDSPASRVGAQIRALRTAAQLSGQDLARASGVSRSMLSRIERGLVSPSVDTLERIAKGLGVPTARFFADQADRLDFSLVRCGSGVAVERLGAVTGYRYELLGHLLSGQMFVEPYLVRLEEGASPYSGFQHAGLKFVHLLNGRLRYRYGPRIMELAPGDSLLFDAGVLHGVESIDERPASYLSIVFTMRG
jgi:transcriptional regulator with XRE-family HTH domain